MSGYLMEGMVDYRRLEYFGDDGIVAVLPGKFF